MKNIFVLNPNSGKAKKRTKLLSEIKEAEGRLGLDCDIYFTKEEKDGEKYVHRVCREYQQKGENLRIYGCGGDGTLNEMVNGCFGFDNVEIGIVPVGTGNDYVRNYGKPKNFMNIERQLTGTAIYSDLIYYNGVYNNKITERYCANMFNIGFDCNVVDMTSRVKRWPLVSGSLAYLLSVLIILVKKKGTDVRIEYEDGSSVDGNILLVAIANGCFCGGGVKGVPYSITDDGLMDVSVVKDITRRFFISLFPSYAKGTHLENKKIKGLDVIRYTKEKTLKITANRENLRLCTDGEITTQKEVKFHMVKKGFKFILPSGIK